MSKSKKIVLAIVGVFVLLMVGAACSGGSDKKAAAVPATSATPSYPVETVEQAPVDEAPSSSSETSSQENSRESAENYLDTMAFSRKGLIKQLSSEYGEGFSRADAIYAVDHIDVDWYGQAAKSAENYLDGQSFSRSGLIEQLESEYGEGFTHAQAVYGVAQAY
jgi:Host cell surface-exposed lipoprotein